MVRLIERLEHVDYMDQIHDDRVLNALEEIRRKAAEMGAVSPKPTIKNEIPSGQSAQHNITVTSSTMRVRAIPLPATISSSMPRPKRANKKRDEDETHFFAHKGRSLESEGRITVDSSYTMRPANGPVAPSEYDCRLPDKCGLCYDGLSTPDEATPRSPCGVGYFDGASRKNGCPFLPGAGPRPTGDHASVRTDYCGLSYSGFISPDDSSRQSRPSGVASSDDTFVKKESSIYKNPSMNYFLNDVGCFMDSLIEPSREFDDSHTYYTDSTLHEPVNDDSSFLTCGHRNRNFPKENREADQSAILYDQPANGLGSVCSVQGSDGTPGELMPMLALVENVKDFLSFGAYNPLQLQSISALLQRMEQRLESGGSYQRRCENDQYQKEVDLKTVSRQMKGVINLILRATEDYINERIFHATRGDDTATLDDTLATMDDTRTFDDTMTYRALDDALTLTDSIVIPPTLPVDRGFQRDSVSTILPSISSFLKPISSFLKIKESDALQQADTFSTMTNDLTCESLMFVPADRFCEDLDWRLHGSNPTSQTQCDRSSQRTSLYNGPIERSPTISKSRRKKIIKRLCKVMTCWSKREDDMLNNTCDRAVRVKSAGAPHRDGEVIILPCHDVPNSVPRWITSKLTTTAAKELDWVQWKHEGNHVPGRQSSKEETTAIQMLDRKQHELKPHAQHGSIHRNTTGVTKAITKSDNGKTLIVLQDTFSDESTLSGIEDAVDDPVWSELRSSTMYSI